MTKKSSKSGVKMLNAPVVAATPETLTIFIDEITKYARGKAAFKCYRGQRDASWQSIPSLYRPDLVELEKNEKRAVRDLISVHPNEFSADTTMFDRLVRMQHFGLPTRLLDVSLNPLVALYFATDPGPEGNPSAGVVTAFAIPEEREKYYDSDSVSCIANLANMTKTEKDKIVSIRAGRLRESTSEREIKRVNEEEEVYKRLHQFIRSEKPYFLPIIKPIDLFKPYYVHAKMSNRRIVAQSGSFIIYGLTPVRRIRYRRVIEETRFIIPEDKKRDMRDALELLGINESNLFPELDRAAKRIETIYSRR